MIVVPMRDTDIETVTRIERASFTRPWSNASFYNELHNPIARNYVVRMHGRNPSGKSNIAGYACFHLISDELHLLKLAVRPELRRRNIAENLLCTCFDKAAETQVASVLLEVRRSNRAAIGLYEKLGFETIGIRRDYYMEYSGQNEDAIIMRKNLKRR